MLGPTMITTPVSNGWLYPAQTPTIFWEREAEKKNKEVDGVLRQKIFLSETSLNHAPMCSS